MPRSPFILATGCGMLALTVFVRAQGSGPVPPAPTAADKLFSKIFPVFAHPRCANCHGVVQHYPGFTHSVTPDTHPGGAVGAGLPDPTVECTDCHDKTADKWQFTAPPNMEWAGLGEDELCAMQAAEVRLKNKEAGGEGAFVEHSYLNHLSSDVLIQQAWLGYAGGARPVTDPKLPAPPLDYPDFLKAAGEWVAAGAPCRTTAYVSHVEEQKTAYTTRTPSGQLVSFDQTAKREVNIVRYRDGSATATITAGGSNQMVSRTALRGCEAVTTVRDFWERTGPATVPATFEITVEPDDYTIRIGLPSETTHGRTTAVMTNTCGVPSPAIPDSSIDLEWPPFEVILHCPTEFPNGDGTMGCRGSEPREVGAADGALHQTVIDASDAADPRSWLYRSPMAIARVDTGGGLPVHVKITWAIRVDQK